MINSNGLRTEPWCTPTLTLKALLSLPFTLIVVVASSYMVFITDTIHSSTPKHLKAHQTTSQGTLSKPGMWWGSWRKHDVIFIVTPDVVGLGLPNDNNFQPITRFVSIALLGNEIIVSVILHGYGGKHETCCLWEWRHYLYFVIFSPMLYETFSS